MISWALSNTVPPAHDHMVHTPRDPLGRLLRILALRPATEGHTPVSMTPITAHKARTTADMDLTKSAEEGPQRPHVWVVRANGGKYTDHFVTGGYAAVEWEAIELSSVSSLDDLRRRYHEAYPDDNAKQASVNVRQLAAFHLDMREGDYVITPTGDTEWLLYGHVTGGTVHASADDGYPYRNRRSVELGRDPAAAARPLRIAPEHLGFQAHGVRRQPTRGIPVGDRATRRHPEPRRHNHLACHRD